MASKSTSRVKGLRDATISIHDRRSRGPLQCLDGIARFYIDARQPICHAETLLAPPLDSNASIGCLDSIVSDTRNLWFSRDNFNWVGVRIMGLRDAGEATQTVVRILKDY